MNISELKAQVLAAQEANKAAILEASEFAMLEATLKLESSKDLFEAKVKLAVSGSNTKILQDLVDECEAIVDSVPVHNTKTRTIRKWNGSRRYSFGTQINLMYQLATGIMYSCSDHKMLLLAHTGLDTELLEKFAESFGTPAYYSRNNNVVVESAAYSVDDVLTTIAVMQSELNVIVDTSMITTEAFSLDFGKAEVRAYSDKLKADEAMEEAEFVL